MELLIQFCYLRVKMILMYKYLCRIQRLIMLILYQIKLPNVNFIFKFPFMILTFQRGSVVHLTAWNKNYCPNDTGKKIIAPFILCSI